MTAARSDGGQWAVNAATAAELAIVVRSGFAESSHLGHACVVDATGQIVAAFGDPSTPIFGRSTLKPAQALACLRRGAHLRDGSLAIAAGSHTGEERHQRLVAEILAAHDLSVDLLRCPADWPEDETTRHEMIRRGEPKRPICMNCSGKHAAMLAAAAVRGDDLDTYLDPSHPLQVEVMETIGELASEPVTAVGVDGCGAPVAALSVAGLARLASAITRTDVGPAMSAYPWAVGGSNHANTSVMEALPGFVSKGGAEGVLILAAPTGTAAAVKVIDGSPRATTLIALALLAECGVDVAAASNVAAVEVLGGGKPVGEVIATVGNGSR